MRKIIIILLLFSCLTTFSQNYTPFPLNQPAHFVFETSINAVSNPYLFGPYYVDSVTPDGSNTQHHIMGNFVEDNYVGDCMESFLTYTNYRETQATLIEDASGVYNYTSYYEHTMTFMPQASIGETWLAASFSQFGGTEVELFLTVESIEPMTFLGITDNVKTITVESKVEGELVSDPMNEMQFLLSENYGLIEFVPFNDFATGNAVQATMIGLEVDGAFVGQKSLLDYSDFLPYEVGDILVFQIRTIYYNGPGPSTDDLETHIHEISDIIVTDSTYELVYANSGNVTYDINEFNGWIDNSYWQVGFSGELGDNYDSSYILRSMNSITGEDVYTLNVNAVNLFLFGTDYCEFDFFSCTYDRSFNSNRGYLGYFSGCEAPIATNYSLIDYLEPGESKFYFSLLLEGAMAPYGGGMIPYLANGDLLPETQPYDVAPYNYSGTETLAAYDNVYISQGGFVDWVLVEVREGTPNLSGSKGTTTVATKAALLASTGQLYGPDGSRGIYFDDLDTDANYHFCIRHRNHLDVLTATASTAPVMAYDFSQSVDQAFGIAQQKIYGSQAVLHAGDFSQDGIIQTTDYDLWAAEPAQNQVYVPTDANIDGVVQATDYDLWFLNKAKVGSIEISFD